MRTSHRRHIGRARLSIEKAQGLIRAQQIARSLIGPPFAVIVKRREILRWGREYLAKANRLKRKG
jgi:hypothetical protein